MVARLGLRYLIISLAILSTSATTNAQGYRWTAESGAQVCYYTSYAFIHPIVTPFLRISGVKIMGNARFGTGLEYSMKGANFKGGYYNIAGDTLVRIANRERLHYLVVPLIAEYQVGRFTFEMGIYGAFQFFGHENYYSEVYVNGIVVKGTRRRGKIPEEDYRKFSAGMELGLGWDIGRSTLLLTYAADLTTLEKEKDETITANILIRLSVRYKLWK